MDELDRMFRRLVEVVRADYPSLIDRPIEVGELYQSVLPYRHHRRALGFETNQDYELAMMRLLSGERGYVGGDPRMQERLRQELGASNPDLALFRGFATTTVTLDPDAVRRAQAGETPMATAAAAAPTQGAPAAPAAPAVRPIADQPVTQRVADDRMPERAAASRPPSVPVSSPDAETIVFRRSPAMSPMPPMPSVMSPPPAGVGPTSPPPAASAAPAPQAASSGATAQRPTEPILLRSNETLTIKPSGEVESSLGTPLAAAGAAAAGAAGASPSPTPLPSVGPPPRPRAPQPPFGQQQQQQQQQALGAESTAAASSASSSTAAANASPAAEQRGGSRVAATSTSPSPRSPMATPQRGASTIVASGDCRYCGGALPDGRRITFCPHCGQNLTIQHCPACSSELELGWKFCTTCGRAVGETATATASGRT